MLSYHVIYQSETSLFLVHAKHSIEIPLRKLIINSFFLLIQISILDPANLSLLFSGCWPGYSSCIARLRFSTTLVQEENAVDSSASADPNSGEPKSSANAITVLYAVNEEATVAVMNGSNGDFIGPGPKQPVTPSQALCLDLVGQDSLRNPFLHSLLCFLVPGKLVKYTCSLSIYLTRVGVTDPSISS